MTNVKELAEAHWSYVKEVIQQHDDCACDEDIEKIGFHYKTAFIHGYKHAKEEFDVRVSTYPWQLHRIDGPITYGDNNVTNICSSES